MISNNIKSKKAGGAGFTIVELLVVIVVIGILAAITIISYTGITARAKTTQAQSNAQSAVSVAEVMNADDGHYPTTAALLTAGSQTTKMPGGVTVVADALGLPLDEDYAALTSGDATDHVAYGCKEECVEAMTGGRIVYFDTAANVVKAQYFGDAVSTDTFVGEGE